MLKMILLVFAVLLFLGSLAVAQTDAGFPSYESFTQISPYEWVNNATLGQVVRVPLRSKGGPIPTSAVVIQNVQAFDFSNTWENLDAGVLFTLGESVIEVTAVPQAAYCPDGKTLTNTFTFGGVIDGSDAGHPVPAQHWDSLHCLYTTTIDVFTTDNSGYEIVIPQTGSFPTATVYDRAGFVTTLTATNYQQVGLGALNIKDPHGNTLTINSGNIADQLSATPVISFSGSNGQTNYTYNDGTGTQRTITVGAPSHTFSVPSSLLNQPGCTDAGLSGGSPLSSVVYPDNSSLQLTYETGSYPNSITGRISTLQVPTGATYTHTYPGGFNNSGMYCSGTTMSTAGLAINDGSGTWTFSRTTGSGTASFTTLTKPDGSKVYRRFTSNMPTQRIIYDTDGTTVLDTKTWCYDSTISNCNPNAPTNHPSVVRAYHYVPGIASPSETDTFYDTHGNVTEVDRYDYGPTLVSKAITQYGSWNGTSCAPIDGGHITNKPCTYNLEDPSGSTNYRASVFNYNTTTGDLLTEYDYTTTSTFLSTTATYNSNGTVASIAGPDNVQTTFAYNGTGGCNSLMPTSATSAIGTVSTTWDCNLAAPLTTTDLNGLVVTNAYGDPLDRVTQVSDNGGQASINYVYTSPTQSRKYMTFNSNTSIDDTTTTLNSLGQVLAVQHRRGPNDSNYDTVSFSHDATGHLTALSTACFATIGATCPTNAVQYTYDGLRRPLTKTILTTTTSQYGVVNYTYPSGDVNISITPATTGENVKTVQIERDGLGREVSVCAVTSGLSGRGSCGQRATATGYLTKYSLDPAGQTTQISRNAQGTAVNSNFTFDLLGRTTQATLPESGTTHAYFDAVTSACQTYASSHGLTFNVHGGQLGQTTDAANNVNCMTYESMGRLAAVYPISGPNSSASTVSTYCYDGACNNSGNYLLGRMSATSTWSGSTLKTDRVFGYDIYGRTTDVWQLSPGTSPNYFHTTASYFDNGALKTLSGIPGVSNYTFGIDVLGRPNSATAGSTTIVSSLTRDAASNPTIISYGNGDSDLYNYDSASENVTQYQFKVGSAGTIDQGALTWNPNGTLQKLAITDNLSSTDTQTCTTAHDDLVRITSFNCGSVWNESYAYSPDDAGNVTKSGSLSFNPGYVASTNRYASGSGFTYDANGNILHDATLSQDYTWDSFGSMASYTGNTIVNDSLGNEVQRTVGGNTYYWVYSPIGLLGSTSSLTSANSIRIPLPGGALTTYGPGTQYLYHQDHTGSARLITNFSARTLYGVVCYGPMGEVYCGTSTAAEYKGAFQDTSYGLDDFNATRYSGAQGRSISPTGGANGYVKDNSPF